MSAVETILCEVVKPVRIYGIGYIEGATVEVQRVHLNHFGKSIRPSKKQTVIKKEGDK